MVRENEFDRLEEFVKKMLASYDRLREDNRLLQEQLEEKDAEIHQLQGQLASADTERGDISSRVRGLIDQIEAWQETLEDDSEAAEVESSDATTEVAEEVVYSNLPQSEEVNEEGVVVGTEEADNEKESAFQHNLFNVGPRSE